MMKKKKIINNFYKELTNLFKNPINYNNAYFMILNYYKKIINLYDFNLQLPKQYLKEYFKNNTIEFETIFKYNNYYLFNIGKKKIQKTSYFLRKYAINLSNFIMK